MTCSVGVTASVIQIYVGWQHVLVKYTNIPYCPDIPLCPGLPYMYLYPCQPGLILLLPPSGSSRTNYGYCHSLVDPCEPGMRLSPLVDDLALEVMVSIENRFETMVMLLKFVPVVSTSRNETSSLLSITNAQIVFKLKLLFTYN